MVFVGMPLVFYQHFNYGQTYVSHIFYLTLFKKGEALSPDISNFKDDATTCSFFKSNNDSVCVDCYAWKRNGKTLQGS